MQLLSLTLKGFRGIRDGLGLDTLTLDLEALCDGAELVAITGANGRGKSTLLDSLHPYLTMPSRAAAAGAGGFSYYDHVFLPESEKELVWALEGRCFRSHVVIRLNGRRRTEAYLFALQDDGSWRPMVLDDGTVSDGKVETYTRCVEHLCGSADTFFTSVFGAQGKRQLSDYRNAEVKALLADLLGQDRIRALGQQASETARLLKVGLLASRQEAAALESESAVLARELAAAANAPAQVERASSEVTQAARHLETARQLCAKLAAQREQTRQTDQRRGQLLAERLAAQAAHQGALLELDRRERSERQRLERLSQRASQRAAEVGQRRQRLLGVLAQCRGVLAREVQVRSAVRRLALAERVLAKRAANARHGQEELAGWDRALAALGLLAERTAGLEREAGRAVLQAQTLARRLALTSEVPCRGLELQGQCKLLADAREAQALIPSAGQLVERLAEQKLDLECEARALRAQVAAQGDVVAQLAAANRRLERTRARASKFTLLAARRDDIALARQRLAEAEDELAELDAAGSGNAAEANAERAEQDAVATALRGIEAQRVELATRYLEAMARIDAVLLAVPAAFDDRELAAAVAARDQAVARHESAQRTQLEILQRSQRWEDLHSKQGELGERQAASRRRAGRIENAVADWTLLARCMSNDGLIALAIDDAGPALSTLANGLLLACYGPRFTVSIQTQSETAKGEKREDFDVIVHDAESGERKSVRLMSGGERVWVNEALLRAVALYLAQTSERRYETLFSDEVDGPLDPERKRMFGAMKREVLRQGGYRREYFVSQTPELAGMADTVIDLDALRRG